MMSNSDLAFLALTLSICAKKKEKRKRRWSKNWYLLRNRFTHDHLLNVLQETDPEDYNNFLRMDLNSFNILLELIRPKIEKKDTIMREAIPARQRLSITLRYLATGMDIEDLKFVCAIAPRTLEGIIMETCEAIIEKLKDNIQCPKTSDQWKQVAQDFEDRWNFPNCIGSTDGKHITIQKPANSGSYYYNYKGTFSIVLMAIVDANYQFLMIDVGANGRISDGGVLKNTIFWQKLSKNELNIPNPRELPSTSKQFPYVFIGDEAFQLMPNFMKPYNRSDLTDEKRIFNYRLSRARRIVENAFGILTSRFKIFQKNIKFAPNKARKIVMACCHIHNFLSKTNRNFIQHGDVDHEDNTTGTILPGSWRLCTQQLTELQRQRSNSALEAKNVRDDFCEFFNTTGAVPWQNNCLYNN